MHHDRWFLENISERRLCSCTGLELGLLVAGLAGTAHTIYQATNKDDSDIPDMPAPPVSAPEAEKEAYKSAQLARKRRQTQQRKVAGVEGRQGTILTGNLTGNKLGGAPTGMQPNEIGGMNASGKSYGSAPAPKTLLGG